MCPIWFARNIVPMPLVAIFCIQSKSMCMLCSIAIERKILWASRIKLEKSHKMSSFCQNWSTCYNWKTCAHMVWQGWRVVLLANNAPLLLRLHVVCKHPCCNILISNIFSTWTRVSVVRVSLSYSLSVWGARHWSSLYLVFRFANFCQASSRGSREWEMQVIGSRSM